MGRIIGGVIVGLLSSWIMVAILLMILAVVLGADGIRDAADKSPTQMWLIVMLIVTGITAYIGGMIARAIGKDKKAVYGLMGLVVLLSIWGIVSQGSQEAPPQPENVDELPAFVKTMMAMGEAQLNAPKWFGFASPILSLLGLALGGLSKSDIAKEAPAPSDMGTPPTA